jgi:hypothetical protein
MMVVLSHFDRSLIVQKLGQKPAVIGVRGVVQI